MIFLNLAMKKLIMLFFKLYLSNSDNAAPYHHGPSVAKHLVNEVAADKTRPQLRPLVHGVEQHVLCHANVKIYQNVVF